MKQALHIFAKDVRHFWPEIAVSVTIMVLYAWIGRYAWAATVWAGGVPQGAEQLNRLANIMPVLIQLSWWVLITRLVQTESLVGDRQWWITKPYEWPRLLGGKGLFLAVFVALPLLVVQCVLMVQAGFQPAEYLAGMGFDLLLVATILVLPLMVVATVTSGFGKMTLVLIGLLLAVVLIIATAGWAQQNRYSAPFDWGVFYMVLAAVLAAIIVLQYARRRTWIARLMFAGLVIVFAAAAWLGNTAPAVAMVYPRGRTPLTLSANVKPTVYSAKGISDTEVVMMLPLTVTGEAADAVVTIDAVKMSIAGHDGERWTSNWQPSWKPHVLAIDPVTGVNLLVDKAFYDRVRTKPVEMDLSFALTELRVEQTTHIVMPARDFMVEGFGVCTPVKDWTGSNFNSVWCRSAMRQPPVTHVSLEWSSTPCDAAPSGQAGVAGSAWAGSDVSDPAEFGISPVQQGSLPFSNSVDRGYVYTPGMNHPRYLCAGTPLTFTRYAVVGRSREDVTLKNFQLPDWRQPVINGNGIATFGVE